MGKILDKIKSKLGKGDDYEVPEEEYIEVNPDNMPKKSKIMVRPFILEDFEDTKEIIDIVREGYTIALINIKPLRDRDLVELKRAINKMKKTVDAMDGDIAGFGEDWITIVPSYATIYRGKSGAQLPQ
jgi:SepF-like predicted cell division protein (DUF552 family)